MKIQHATIKYYIEDALIEINKIMDGCDDKKLEEEAFLVHMEHALHMFNFAYNARYLSLKETGELSDKDYQKKTLPPIDIFR